MYILLDIKKFLLVICYLLFTINSAFAFNEFQTFIEQKSKKQLNCAYCHRHTNGPEGNEDGQLGSLNEEQRKLTAYNQFLQSNKEFIDSPILNEFGNYLVKRLGYETVVHAQNEPEILIDKLKTSDLDEDGISDAEELLNGTLPTDPLDGSPYKLFVSNVRKIWIELCFEIAAVFLIIIALLKLKAL